MADCCKPGCECEATYTLTCGAETVALCEGCQRLVELAAALAVELIRHEAPEDSP